MLTFSVACLLALLVPLLACITSGERLTAADGLDSAEWQEAWSGSDEGDELDQLEVTKPSWLITPHFSVVFYAASYRLCNGCRAAACNTILERWSGAQSCNNIAMGVVFCCRYVASFGPGKYLSTAGASPNYLPCYYR